MWTTNQDCVSNQFDLINHRIHKDTASVSGRNPLSLHWWSSLVVSAGGREDDVDMNIRKSLLRLNAKTRHIKNVPKTIQKHTKSNINMFQNPHKKPTKDNNQRYTNIRESIPTT